MIVDAQIHAYARDSPARPWNGDASVLARVAVLPECDGPQSVAAMDAVGVDAAVLVSSWSTYRWDSSFIETVYAEFPDRFRLVSPIDPTDPDVADRVEQWLTTDGAVGCRLLFFPGSAYDAGHAGIATVVTAATAHDAAVNVQCFNALHEIEALARAFPDAQLVLDHLGLTQPSQPPAPDDAFAELDRVLALAQFPNVAVKLTGVCTYAHEPFPYPDLWEPIARVIDAFGVERLMWGTDWQRTIRLLSYDEGVRAFRDHWPLSPADKAALMGETALRIYRW